LSSGLGSSSFNASRTRRGSGRTDCSHSSSQNRPALSAPSVWLNVSYTPPARLIGDILETDVSQSPALRPYTGLKSRSTHLEPPIDPILLVFNGTKRCASAPALEYPNRGSLRLDRKPRCHQPESGPLCFGGWRAAEWKILKPRRHGHGITTLCVCDRAQRAGGEMGTSTTRTFSCRERRQSCPFGVLFGRETSTPLLYGDEPRRPVSAFTPVRS